MVGDDSRQDHAGDEPAPTVSSDEQNDPAHPPGDVTQILSRIDHGDGHATEQLLPLVYEELRKLAAARMAQERPDQTLQATALVHEAYIRLVDRGEVQEWESRGHFFAAAAEAMRRILVERARRKRGLAAGGQHQRVELSEVDPELRRPELNVPGLSDALDKFAVVDPRRRNSSSCDSLPG